MNQADRDFQRIQQDVQTLTGERGPKLKPEAAVLRGDLAFLAKLKILSSPATSAPTQDQYNALQADIAAIYGALSLMGKQ